MATFLFRFSGVSVKAAVTQHDRWLDVSATGAKALVLGRGNITGGTDAYEHATGTLVGGGTLTFTATGLESHLLFVLNIKSA